MAVEIVTKEDLQIFRSRLLEDFRLLLLQQIPKSNESSEGVKTRHARKLLDCSINKLTLLRVTGKIRCKKIGGTLYYNRADITKLVNEDFGY